MKKTIITKDLLSENEHAVLNLPQKLYYKINKLIAALKKIDKSKPIFITYNRGFYSISLKHYDHDDDSILPKSTIYRTKYNFNTNASKS